MGDVVILLSVTGHNNEQEVDSHVGIIVTYLRLSRRNSVTPRFVANYSNFGSDTRALRNMLRSTRAVQMVSLVTIGNNEYNWRYGCLNYRYGSYQRAQL
jgi:hypothetical protein